MEMLLQSHIVKDDGTRIISILPAIPDEWKSGSFTGLKGRGGITVNCSWDNGKITKLVIDNPLNEKNDDTLATTNTDSLENNNNSNSLEEAKVDIDIN